ncbi:MAG: lysophospholipid acyltransferase family protein [Deferrisomatales bacterium]|nr:lysophospholipid acyltransferase family protein [Deferrisomatales bacterium]
MISPDLDTYHTDPNTPVSWLAKLLPLTRFAFYGPVMEIVWRASRLAARGALDDQAWLRSSNEELRVAEALGMDVQVEGLEHLRRLDGPAVIVGNHMSTLETFLLPGMVVPHRPVTFVVKDTLLTYPVFGHVMRSRNPIVVGRTNPREDFKAVMEGGEQRLAQGISVVVFPQTTRAERFDPERFNSIGAKLAGRAGVPLIPLALRTDAWGNGRWLKDFGPVDPRRPVRFRFGAPLSPDRRGTEAHRQTVAFIQQALGEWGVEGLGG